MIELYTYFRSSASYRVRIALHLKHIPFSSLGVDLKTGAQTQGPFQETNSQKLLPFLKDGRIGLSQSLVILDYLEEIYSKPSLYPKDHLMRYRAREIAQFIACEMHPLNNLRVLKYLSEELKISDEAKTRWYHHWLKEGFDVLERDLSSFKTPFAMDNSPTLVDVCLVPQIYNALRFKFSMRPYPRLMSIYERCLEEEAFIKASPEMQDDCDL